MSKRVHTQASTTPKIRQEIKDSCLSDCEAAKVFNTSRATAAKWLKRDDNAFRAGSSSNGYASITRALDWAIAHRDRSTVAGESA